MSARSFLVRQRRNLLSLLLALALGLFAAYATSNFLSRRLAELEAGFLPEEQIAVVVAKTALAAGSRVGPDTVAVRDMPRSWVHSNAILPAHFNRAEGLSLAWPAAAGEALLWAQLEVERESGFAARLEQGRRAVTVPVDEISSLSGMIAPGDHIDIVLALHQQRRSFTFTLLQNVRVLATGTRLDDELHSDGGGRSYTTLTLDSSPEEARRIIAAREMGRITALLRAPGDHAPVTSSVDDSLSLLGLPLTPSLLPARVPVIYGGGPISESLQLGAAAPAPADPAAAAMLLQPSSHFLQE